MPKHILELALMVVIAVRGRVVHAPHINDHVQALRHQSTTSHELARGIAAQGTQLQAAGGGWRSLAASVRLEACAAT
jgi:hypothetical protein